jgi:mTERF
MISSFICCFLFGWNGVSSLQPRNQRRTQMSLPVTSNSPDANGRLERVEVGVNPTAIHISPKGARIGANLGYFYLQKELKLSEHHMVKIMEKYPWIMYLKVDTNLRPTVEVLKSFGFRDKDVRSMLEKVPPILGINHEWTLPEKLISIQKMFNLNRAGLVKLVVHQPFLLTCSIDRNIRVSEFLSETVGLSPESIRNCLLCCPEVAMSGITKMAACWSVLTDIYGLSDKQARALVMYYPIVLTHRTLKTIQDKVSFFSEELNMSPPFREVQKVIMRYPQLLCIDPNVFMRPNAALLKEYLELDRDGIAKLISFFPSALGYNPKTLEKAIRKSLFMLTGLEEYTTMRGTDEDPDDDEDDLGIFEGEVQDVSNLSLLDLRRGPLSVDDLQSIEHAASSIIDVKDGDILSLHILPSAMDPYLYMNSVNPGETKPHLIISKSGLEGVSHVQLAADIDGEEEYDLEMDVADEGEYNDDDSLEVLDNLFEYESGNKKKGRQREGEDDDYVAVSSLPAQSAGVDVMAEIVTRARVKSEGRHTSFTSTIAEVIAETLSLKTIPLKNDGSESPSQAHSGSSGGSFDSDSSSPAPHTAPHIVAAHAANEIEAMRLLMLVYSTLKIDKARALNVVKSAPWVLSYRPERSLRVLSTLGFSLGMSRSELSRLVRSYPRVLSLSVDGKISEVLTALATTAAMCLSLEDTEAYVRRASLFKTRKGAPEAAEEQEGDGESELVTDLLALSLSDTSPSPLITASSSSAPSEFGGGRDTPHADTDSSTSAEEAQAMGVACSTVALTRRRDLVRTMVRTAVLKWPLLLGTSMSKITAGLEEVLALEVPFDQLIQIIRRNPKTQLKWKNKVLSLAQAAQVKHELKMKRDDDKRSRDETLSRTYYEHEIDYTDDLDDLRMDSEAEMEVLIVKEEELKKAKLEKKKQKAEFIKKIKKVLKPVLERDPTLSTPPATPLEIEGEGESGGAIVIDIEAAKKPKKKRIVASASASPPTPVAEKKGKIPLKAKQNRL